MDDLSRKLDRLGARVSETAERLSDPAELDSARRLFLAAPPPAPSRGRRPLLLGAAVLAATLGFFTWSRPGPRVSFVVGAADAISTPGAVGEWVAAEHSAPLPVRFSEGTSFTLAPGARARVTETTARDATLLLERGDVSAAVFHTGPDTRWNVEAGPFEVRVTGTRFDATWDPTGETFTLSMSEGVVVVKGPLLQSGREIHAGERLRISVREGALTLRAASAPATAEPSVVAPAASAAPAVSAAPAASAAPAVSAAPAPPPSTAPDREPSWRDLAARGKYNEALAAAERAGFAQELDRASSPDLAALADAARYAAQPALARQALLAQRRRFGARGSSAFLLGKIAADQQGGADAVRWFETYLQEEPGGALAEQALGRILELQKGNPAAARAAAERYLARYPNGAHAALARSVSSP
jgi:hypothetical protein